jgi:hypothetical protein
LFEEGPVNLAFSAEQWSRLSKSGRVLFCQRMAEEENGAAESSEPQFRAAFKSSAANWLAVAAAVDGAP